jgi:Dolichyl-phosphate-mannose-protein mannosyltransferase
MPARPAARSDLKIKSQPASSAWVQQFLLFAVFFAGLMLLHAPLLRLPYFWDEAGYYIPAARDLFLTGTLIPESTPSNAHPPLVMAWLALAWHVFGYSTLATRTAMLAVSAFSLLGLFRLSRIAANLPVAWATIALVAFYPVYFTQSSMAQVDLPAAGFTFWALGAYIEGHTAAQKDDRPWKQVVWFSLAALAKETAILAPLALLGWELLADFIRLHGKENRWNQTRWNEILPPADRRARALYLLLPVVPLAGWYAYHDAKTGFLVGNPEFFRYNVAATLNPLRIPLALGMRLWQLFGYFGLYLLTLAGLLAMLRPPRRENGFTRPRIPFWIQAAFLSVVLAYLGFMSLVGGAVLARYMLPVVPLVILVWVSTLWRRVRHWKLIVAAVAIAFVAGLFSNPPYGFSLEDNLAYRDYIVMHAEASRFLAMRYSGARVLTAWPASDELTRPWLGYINVNANARPPFRVLRIDDFSVSQIDVAAHARDRFDVALVFSTKYQPPHALFENWDAWQRIKEKFFGYHRDLLPEEIARRLGGTIVYHKEMNGQWIRVIAREREQDAKGAGSQMRPTMRSVLHPHQVAGMRLDHDPDALVWTKLESVARRQR